MKDFITSLDKGFESRVRLGIMSILVVNDSVDFNTLKEQLNISDGNIASHITALEKLNYLEEKNKPTNPSLWSKAKSLAKQKFDVYPSAYANGWASKWYKKRGGRWRKKKKKS